MRTTYTYVTLEVSAEAYNEIRQKFEAANYQHAIDSDGTIDMHGLALVKAEDVSEDANPDPVQHQNTFTINVNGKDFPSPSVMTYAMALGFAGLPYTLGISVVYHAKGEGDSHRQGILAPHEQVQTCPGMRFTVCRTDNA